LRRQPMPLGGESHRLRQFRVPASMPARRSRRPEQLMARAGRRPSPARDLHRSLHRRRALRAYPPEARRQQVACSPRPHHDQRQPVRPARQSLRHRAHRSAFLPGVFDADDRVRGTPLGDRPGLAPRPHCRKKKGRDRRWGASPQVICEYTWSGKDRVDVDTSTPRLQTAYKSKKLL
jgi:hypothetical protein